MEKEQPAVKPFTYSYRIGDLKRRVKAKVGSSWWWICGFCGRYFDVARSAPRSGTRFRDAHHQNAGAEEKEQHRHHQELRKKVRRSENRGEHENSYHHVAPR